MLLWYSSGSGYSGTVLVPDCAGAGIFRFTLLYRSNRGYRCALGP